jgi:chromosomal replication initiation ATPase DnaA
MTTEAHENLDLPWQCRVARSAKAELTAFCEREGVSVQLILGASRKAKIVTKRHQAFYEVKRKSGAGRWLLGKVFNRDPQTILNGLRRHEARMGA